MTAGQPLPTKSGKQYPTFAGKARPVQSSAQPPDVPSLQTAKRGRYRTVTRIKKIFGQVRRIFCSPAPSTSLDRTNTVIPRRGHRKAGLGRPARNAAGGDPLFDGEVISACRCRGWIWDNDDKNCGRVLRWTGRGGSHRPVGNRVSARCNHGPNFYRQRHFSKRQERQPTGRSEAFNLA